MVLHSFLKGSPVSHTDSLNLSFCSRCAESIRPFCAFTNKVASFPVCLWLNVCVYGRRGDRVKGEWGGWWGIFRAVVWQYLNTSADALHSRHFQNDRLCTPPCPWTRHLPQLLWAQTTALHSPHDMDHQLRFSVSHVELEKVLRNSKPYSDKVENLNTF